jgi:response regulator RpfG family c-di-GMP phosphodiesterase
MIRTEEQYLCELFERLKSNWDFRKEIAVFGKYLVNPNWLIIPVVNAGTAEDKRKGIVGCIRFQTDDRHRFSEKEIRLACAVIRKAEKNRVLEEFHFHNGLKGFCYPLQADGKLFGYVILSCTRKSYFEPIVDLFQYYTDTMIKFVQREMELEELNETIRPRAIALSTVHTVYRLLNSTLILSELLPRIARLSLQVLRANRCSIKLVDKKHRILIPKTTVDLRKATTKLKKVEIGKYAPGRAVKQGRAIIGKDYLAMPLIGDEVIGVITLYDKVDNSEFTNYDTEIMKTMSEQAVIAIKNAQLYQEQENLTMASIRGIAMLVNARPHLNQTMEISFLKMVSLIGRKFNMNDSEIKMLQYAAMLRDTGKISIPEKVLMKRGELTGSEYDIVREHPVKAAIILSKIKPLKTIVPVILHQHENYDGTGYPKGLKKEEIPLGSRILAVVSAFESMVTKKPYRKPLSIDAAVTEVSQNIGTQFDPQIVKFFCEVTAQKNVRKILKKELSAT